MNNLKDRLKNFSDSVLHNALLFILAIGAALRFYQLGAESYWIDEVYTVQMAQRNVWQLIMTTKFDFPPVYFFIAHFWVRLLGSSELATRSFSALVGVISIAIIYFVGRELFGKSVGLIGALMMSISEFQIYYSQETRFYSLFALAALLSFYFYIKALKSQKMRYFLVYVVVSLLLFYSNANGVFIIAAQNLHFLLRWKQHREARARWFFCQTALFLAVAPYVLSAILESARKVGAAIPGIGWIPNPPISALFKTCFEYLIPLRHDRSWMAVFLNIAIGIIFLMIGTATFALWKGKEKWLGSLKNITGENQGRPNKASELSLLGCWLLCPLIILFVLSKIISPMYLSRYTISASPALYLLLAYGITRISKVVPVLVSLFALSILVGPGLARYYRIPINEQWRETAAYVTSNASDYDVIVFAPNENGWQQKSFNWYYRGNQPEFGIGIDLVNNDDKAIADTLAKYILDHERFWLIMRGTPKIVGRLKAFFFNNKQNNLHLKNEKQFTGISIYLFESKKH